MEVFDKDGNPVENVFSQEEVEAKIEESKKTFTQTKTFDKDGNPVENVFSQKEVEAKIEEAKKTFTQTNTNDIKQTESSNAVKPEEIMAALTALQATVGLIVKSTETTGASKFTANLDDEKKTAFNTQFEALQKTGLYENTPEGIEKRAAAAYVLTTGESIDAGNFNMGNLSSVGSKAPVKVNTETSETDKQISAALGNTEEDIKKYGGN